MLYIASAITPTPIVQAIPIPSLTLPGSHSLVIAKPDCIQVWDATETGLVQRAHLQVWGNIVSIARAEVSGIRPHIVVLLSPPDAQLLLVTFEPGPTPSLVVTSSIPLTPPTPALRRAEFFNSVVAQGNAVLVSLWVGVLACIEIEVEKEKDAKRRRSSVATTLSDAGDGKRLTFRDNYNINIREHNLLHLAFLPPASPAAEPTVIFLWLSSMNNLLLQSRRLSLNSHSFMELSKSVDVLTPLRSISLGPEADFAAIPYSCPAARNVLAVSHDSVLVIGDEYSVMYSLTVVPQTPKAARGFISSQDPVSTSPRASATRRSPQAEITLPGKRRKSSVTSGRLGMESNETYEIKPVWRGRQGFGTVLAASVVESHTTGATVLLGDETGRLTAYGWETENVLGEQGNVRLSKVDFGSTSPPSSLTYIDSGYVFVASACGDPTLIRLELGTGGPASPSDSPSRASSKAIPMRKGKTRAREDEEGAEWTVILNKDKGSFELKERWINLAPLKDFCIVEDDRQNFSHLITGSGDSTSNSLRIIRSGVGLEDLLTVDGVQGVEAIFPLSPGILLVSTATASHLIQVEPKVSLLNLDSNISTSSTLAVIQLGDSVIIANRQSVNLYHTCCLSSQSGQWKSSEEITAVAADGEFVIVGAKGGNVIILQAGSQGLQKLLLVKVKGEISAVAIIANEILSSPVVAIATWSKDIFIYTFNHLKTSDVPVTPINTQAYASALLLRPSPSTETSGGLQLFAGLGSGALVVHDLALAGEGDGITCQNRKSYNLGYQPLQLSPLAGQTFGDDEIVTIGLSERISIVFSNRDRLQASTVNRKGVTAAATTTYNGQNSLVFASPEGLSFVKVQSLKKLSVQTLDLGHKSPMRVTKVEHQPVVGVGILSRQMDPETGDSVQRGTFELRDDTTLEQMPLGEREEVTTINNVMIRGEIYLAVGTAIYPEPESDVYADSNPSPREGNLFLLQPRKDTVWTIVVKTTLKTVGPVHDLVAVYGFLAVAAGSKVTVYRLDLYPFALFEVDNYSSAFIAQRLEVLKENKKHPERLIVGDGMRSLFMLFMNNDDGTISQELRDASTYQVMELSSIEPDGTRVLVADGYSGLLTFDTEGSLDRGASFGLHEDVTRFRHGYLGPQCSAPEAIKPRLVYATDQGRIGVIGDLSDGATQTLSDLQRNMAQYRKGPGGVDWKVWRRGGIERMPRETAGFIDGDFVQQFLDTDLLPSSEATRVFQGTNPHERITRLGGDGQPVEAERSDVVDLLESVGGVH